MSNVIKVKLLSERTSGAPPVISIKTQLVAVEEEDEMGHPPTYHFHSTMPF